MTQNSPRHPTTTDPLPVEPPYAGGSTSPATGTPVFRQLQFWQGQYPPPEAVERYEKILPGTFAQMVEMARQLQTAQIEGNERAQKYMQADTRRGHYLGALISLAAMGCAVASLYLGYPWVAGAFLSVPVMGVANAFVNPAHKHFLSDANKAAQTQGH